MQKKIIQPKILDRIDALERCDGWKREDINIIPVVSLHNTFSLIPKRAVQSRVQNTGLTQY